MQKVRRAQDFFFGLKIIDRSIVVEYVKNSEKHSVFLFFFVIQKLKIFDQVGRKLLIMQWVTGLSGAADPDPHPDPGNVRTEPDHLLRILSFSDDRA
jgi:hypothetical protein